MSDDQTRAHPRIKKLNLVQVSRFDEEGFRADLATGRTLDLSCGGMRLELHHALPLRSIVSVTLALDDDLVDVRGRVVYLQELDEERCAMGIEFTELGDRAAALLERYVARASDDRASDDRAGDEGGG